MLLLLAIAAGFFTVYLLVQSLRPLTERGVVTAEDWQRVEDESVDLLLRRDRLIAELRDLEFEASLDKIAGRDLEELRARYAAEALEVDRRLQAQTADYQGAIDAAVDERLTAPAKGATAAGAAGVPDAAAADAGTARGASAEAATPKAPAATSPEVAPEDGQAAIVCGACSASLPGDARFCDQCGARATACPECKADNRPGARFCKGCGHDLSGAAEEAKA